MVRPRDHEVEVEIQSILLTAEAGCLVVEASATGTRGGDEELDVDSSLPLTIYSFPQKIDMSKLGLSS